MKGSFVVVLVELVGLWFSNKKFGLKWNVTQVKNFVDKKLPEGEFLMDSDSDTGKGTQKPGSGGCLLDSDSD